jgi:TIR domain
MSDAPGLIFLSHSKEDKIIVDQVRKKLDSSVLFYDIRSIVPGAECVAAMREAISAAAVFVLFHSPNAKSHWVRFEKDVAEIARIESRSMRILTCPLGGESYNTLPEWMQRHMTTTPDFKPNDIARTIDYLYVLANNLEPGIYEGREDLERQISNDVTTAPARTGRPLNVVILSGIQGMGRGTVAQNLTRRIFRGMRPAGPIFDVPDAADAIDWHLELYQDLNGQLSPYQMALQMDAFPDSNADQAAEFIERALVHWEQLNQVVTIRSRWGLRERGHDIKPWLARLFNRLEKLPALKLILISDRKLPADKIAQYPNARQYSVDELPDETIEYILSRSISPQFLRPERLEIIAQRVHGHPATANHVAFLVNGGITLDSLCQFPAPVHAFQDKTLEGVYNNGILTELQGKILRLLSWLPKLSGDVFREIFVELETNDLFTQLWRLNEYSLITQAEGGYYRVPAIVSSTFRRFTGTEDDELLKKVAEVLRKRFDSGDISVDLIESLLIGVVHLEGELPESLLGIVTPAKLSTVVEEQYNRGMSGSSVDVKSNFLLAAKLAELALAMRCPDDDTLENILFLGADALVRAGEYPSNLLPIMYSKGFSSAHYVEGSYLYHIKRDYTGAAQQIELALKAGHFLRRSVRLLARIYLRAGRFDLALAALNRIEETRLLRDTGLVIMKIRALRALRRPEEARELQQRIGSIDDDFGDIAIYSAGQALREGNVAAAKQRLEEAQRAPRSNKVTLKFLECAIAIEAKDFSQLPEACALANAAGRDGDALQLQARAAIVNLDWRAAERYLSQIPQKDYFDLAVELRMLELKLADNEVQRDPVQLKAAQGRKEEVLREALNTVEGARFQ